MLQQPSYDLKTETVLKAKTINDSVTTARVTILIIKINSDERHFL